VNEKLKYRVLDLGFIELFDLLGSDLRAVEAARVSFQKGLSSEEKDKTLIDYLMKNGHESPFEHIVFTFRIKAPLFVSRQWLRHRIASVNEISQRYSFINEEFYIPKNVRVQDKENRQSAIIKEDEDLQKEISLEVQKISELSYNTYCNLIEKGVARELARVVLPLNMYTMWFWTVNVRSLMNFLNLRADSHAQWEIQEYARAAGLIFYKKCPWIYKAFFKNVYRGNLLKENPVSDEIEID